MKMKHIFKCCELSCRDERTAMSGTIHGRDFFQCTKCLQEVIVWGSYKGFGAGRVKQAMKNTVQFPKLVKYSRCWCSAESTILLASSVKTVKSSHQQKTAGIILSAYSHGTAPSLLPYFNLTPPT
jgi:hypothetical protein